MIAMILARYGFHIGIAAAVGVAVFTWDSNRIKRAETRGKQEVVQSGKQKGAEANAKNEKVRRDSAAPGALGRLQRDPATCVDCRR